MKKLPDVFGHLPSTLRTVNPNSILKLLRNGWYYISALEVYASWSIPHGNWKLQSFENIPNGYSRIEAFRSEFSVSPIIRYDPDIFGADRECCLQLRNSYAKTGFVIYIAKIFQS